MILATILILSLISSFFFALYVPVFNEWYDFWKIIVFFLGCIIAFFLLFLVYVAIYVCIFCRGKEDKGTKFSHRFMKRICEFLCQVGCLKIHVRGLENVPTDQKFMLVQNHLSLYDPIVTVWALRYFDFSFIYKKNFDKIKPLKWFFHRDGHLALDRENNRHGLETIVKAMHKIQKDEACIGIYPEGTRSKTGEISKFHSGSFKIAEKSQCPIVITAIENTDAARKRILLGTHIYLDIIEVLYYEDYKDISTIELSEICHQKIVDRLNELEVLKYKNRHQK